jgi:TolB-like protein/Tfp pilus assembly protein PilF
MGVLVCLAQHAGNPVSKDELLQEVWPDTFVTEDALKRCISELRRVLEDDARQPQVIETIPKRGYRLIAAVTTGTEEASARVDPAKLAGIPKATPVISRRWKHALTVGLSAALLIAGGRAIRTRRKSAGAQPPGKTRLVVLPFQNLNGDPAQDYLSAGLTDEITTQLAQLDPVHLGVIASTSSKLMAGKSVPEVTRLLNVQYVLEGSVRRDGDRMRIDAQLIQASDETHVWASSYTRELTDILKVQAEVSEAVARQIPGNLHLSVPAPAISGNARAHEAYLKAKLYLDNRSDPEKSLHWFEEAIREEPNYALAYAGMSQVYALLGEVPYNVIVPREANRKGREAARHALEIDPTLAQAHAALGTAAFNYDWDLRAAKHEYQLALELNPGDATVHEWLGLVYMVQGETKQALEEGQRSLDLDPVSPACHAFLSQAYYFAGDYDHAVEQARSILEVQPNFLQARYWLGSAYLRKRKYPEALEQFRQARDASARNPVTLMGYGYAQALAGNPDEARTTLRELEARSKNQYVPAVYFAGIYLGLSDNAQAMNYLNQAYQERSDRMIYLGVEPMVDPLRSNPDFRRLLHQIALASAETN